MSAPGLRSRRLRIALTTSIAGLVFWGLLARVEALRAAAEAASMNHVVARLRTAVVMANAAGATHASAPSPRAGTNPMSLLSSPPSNYVGSFRGVTASDVPKGRWFFDENQQILVYRVRHDDDFIGGADGVTRVRFKIVTPVPDGGSSDAGHSEVGSPGTLFFRAVEPYEWGDRRDDASERNEG